MQRYKKWKFIVPAALIGFALFVLLGGWVVAQLWNWLLPSLFGFPTLTVWQALGLLTLTRILFGGFGVGGWGSSRKMSPGERERIRERMCKSAPEIADSPKSQA